MEAKSDIVSFFEGEKGDFKGRKLSEILAWSDYQLETCHDYIQVLFPLPEESPFNTAASPIDREVFDAFQSREELRKSLRGAFTRMLSFYGFKWQPHGNEMEIILAENFKSAGPNWVHGRDHNHLRMTRIIRSLRVLALEKEALSFFRVLKRVQQASSISASSLSFWTRAAQRPLNIAPHISTEDEDRTQGPEFLVEFENMRRRAVVNKK